MNLKKIGLLLVAVGLFAGCERKREPNKIMDGFVAGSFEIVVPAQAAQQFILLKRDVLTVVVPVLTKMQYSDSTFSELSGPASSIYSFQTTEKHYGTANFTLEFRDDNNATIDPIAVRGSSNTLKSVAITAAVASAAFPTITESLTLVLESSGVVTSPQRLKGQSVFTGSSYSLTFQLDPSGNKAIFEGLTDGIVTATGAGGTPPSTANIYWAFGTDRNANGSLTWEAQEGSLHVETNGSGFVVTPEGRFLLE